MWGAIVVIAVALLFVAALGFTLNHLDQGMWDE